MATRRTTRWNGELTSLSIEFLKDVIERMELYGEELQIEFPGHAKHPSYQLTNSRGFKMAFDGKHLLLPLNENGVVSDNLSQTFTLTQVRQALVAPAPTARRTATRSAGSRASGAARTRTIAAEPDQIEVDKYAYFRTHREQLPAGIQAYSQQISDLMRAGSTAEAAFAQVIAEHF